MHNPFLVELLTLQQDGRGAISAPVNWAKQQPLLEVPTPLDVTINELTETLLGDPNSPTRGRWHFFIGSPGNGKSAAAGKLVNHLIDSYQCTVRDEEGTDISELSAERIPYSLSVRQRDAKFDICEIVQDASVVRDPFSVDVDPARDLTHTLSDAWERGISLVVCTNRGVLEKTFQDYHLNPDVNKKPWFKALRRIVEAQSINGTLQGEWSFDPGRKAFSTVLISYSHLDNRSLVLNAGIFQDLLEKAVENVGWTACSECDVNNICPFKANRDWLNDHDAAQKFLRVIRRAEVYSGQVIVLREALALLSLILSGCSKDYPSGSPCDWVRNRASQSDFFALLSRRIYMLMFSSHAPYGLEWDAQLRAEQVSALAGTVKGCVLDSVTKKALLHVVNTRAPSGDVGVQRLTAANQVFAQLDEWSSSQPPEFVDRWVGDLNAVANAPHPLMSELETRCFEIWLATEDALSNSPSHEIAQYHWYFKRWTSNFLIHFGELVEGRTAWSEELDEFIELLNALLTPKIDRSLSQKLFLRDVDKKIERLLSALTADTTGASVPLTESTRINGQWVEENLQPQVDKEHSRGSLYAHVVFHGNETAILSGRAYVWLLRHFTAKLNLQCFPGEILVGLIDARIRAAAKGGDKSYAYAPDEVTLLVSGHYGERYELTRIDGETHVSK